MPVPSLLLTTAKTSIFLWGAGWSVQLYRQRMQRTRDQEQYDLETKNCPTWEELMAMRAAKEFLATTWKFAPAAKICSFPKSSESGSPAAGPLRAAVGLWRVVGLNTDVGSDKQGGHQD
ncbi:hypothetical protein BDZ45DRAFT_690546 [Acephala macrosclerotiorum]|nr:hypothetical protein BDZ45DRAFT_690546 [Acephala macrosclerotiorum]